MFVLICIFADSEIIGFAFMMIMLLILLFTIATTKVSPSFPVPLIKLLKWVITNGIVKFRYFVCLELFCI